MPVEEIAVIPAESVTAPVQPTFDASDQNTWSSDQRADWNKTGNVPKPEKQDSAPAKKEPAVADSAPQKDEKAADSASDSATDKKQEPHLKTKEDTERRIQQFIEENRTLKQRLEALERGKPSDTRDTKQESQPATEVKTPPLKQFLDQFFAKDENKGKAYEDGVEAWQVIRDAARVRELEQQVRSQIATETAQKELNARVAEAQKRYPDYQERIQPAVKAIHDDAAIPFAVKAMINGSPVFEDLLYVIGEPAALADLIQTAKTNPIEAITKIVLTQQVIQDDRAKANGKGSDGKDETKRDASGKFVSEKKDEAPEPKPRAPKPVSEVGGRGTASEDSRATAAKAGDFASFEAEENRRMQARFKS